MVLHKDSIDQTFLLPTYIRKLILEKSCLFFYLETGGLCWNTKTTKRSNRPNLENKKK